MGNYSQGALILSLICASAAGDGIDDSSSGRTDHMKSRPHDGGGDLDRCGDDGGASRQADKQDRKEYLFDQRCFHKEYFIGSKSLSR